LTYKGESSYSTVPGAIMSMFLKLLMTAFTSYRLMIFINRLNPTTGIQTNTLDLEVAGPLKKQ